MFKRSIKQKIISYFFKGEVILLIGARQVGKTSLIESIIHSQKIQDESLLLNCDYIEDRELLNQEKIESLKTIIGNKKYIFIDEGQKVKNIGNTLKMLVDLYKTTKQIVVTGSSSVHILHQTSEPLTGRKNVIHLYPLSIQEITQTNGKLEYMRKFEEFLLFGSYPKILNQNSQNDKIRQLKELVSSNLYRDILEFQLIRNPSVLTKLLKALSLQIGSEVSFHELGNTLGINTRTVEKYVDLLEKSYIIFRLPPYFTNKRKELSKMNKIYFYDLGIRNALINNFNILGNRTDTGALFENYIISERLKHRAYNDIYADQYFWRDYNQNEIDLIEEYNGMLHTFEIKLKKKNVKIPHSFSEVYTSEYKVINKENILDFFITDESTIKNPPLNECPHSLHQ
ncbi:ATPase [Candidatus Peregrinibacteria bacterium]|nr:MAG: ATPase [Candidatus Peregrinibacteria bacterium]